MKNLIIVIAVFFAFAKAHTTQAQTKENILFYWDASLSMQDRNLDIELEYLDTFFEKHKEAAVHFVSFSSEIILEEDYTIVNGNWDALKAELKSTVYDGAVSFASLDFTIQTDRFILSTDGESISSELPEKASAPVHIITNNKNRSIMKLALNSVGSLTNTNKLARKKNRQPTLVTGVVIDANTGGGQALEGAVIKIVGGDKEVITDRKGAYSIEAFPESVLEISYVGKKARRFRVGKQQTLNIIFSDQGDVLKEVVITSRGNNETAVEEKEVDLGQHKIQKKKLGYSVETITDKEISQIDTDVKQAVNGQFAGLEIANDAAQTRVDLSQFLGRHKNMTLLGDQTGLVVIDGVPQSKTDSGQFSGNTGSTGISTHINPDNIASISYLKGLAATNRYGTLGKGGVILITTKSAIAGEVTKRDTAPKGTTATYADTAIEIEALPKTEYIAALQKHKTIDAAFEEYLIQRDTYGSTPSFYLNVADYFKGWNNVEMTSRVLSNVSEIAKNDATALRAMAFKIDEIGNKKKALEVYKYISRIRSLEVQSYRDLALSYAENGDVGNAFNIYQNIVEGKGNIVVNASGIEESLIKEYQNFIKKYKSAINVSTILPRFLKEPEKLKKRIVLEWNHQDAKFDLQIVNPQNRFFTWEHTEKVAAQRLAQEKRDGFQMEEFFLTEDDKGKWTFNIIYYGKITDDDGSPTYMKFTVYDEYGTPKESREVKVVRLIDVNQPYTVLEVTL
ncbi:carboxypeptidase-like regulatory domain-containing protein [uncultured Dokdonia sp.]|uniref:carboxypeptidase-like regulatory domain-containing protein n=1 Tax=uncultured Dokdonia sp. TaxID=575653 RepID=UPI002637BAC4|nr:carboxypeptidase-like regulatory domain-containing protein [uncultured Dokdonia sp.]